MTQPTDWDAYYSRPYPATSVTRRITTRRLLGHITRHLHVPAPHIVELGGANSCFIDSMYKAFRPAQYTVVDNNQYGLSLLAKRKAAYPGLQILQDDVAKPLQQADADMVFSVGLIEHFDEAGTAQAVASHYRFVKRGGLVIISFPTPTWLYRCTRQLAETFGIWKFHDERALQFPEVHAAMKIHGDILARDLIWPIVLTQGVLIGRKA